MATRIGQLRRDGLVKAFHEALKTAPLVMEAFEMVTRMPAPRFYITFERAKRLITAHHKGHVVYSNIHKRVMIAELHKRWVAAGMTDEALLKIITQPAPSFYVTKETVMVTVYSELRKKKKRIWQDC